MAARIPVGDTIEKIFVFSFGRYFTVLGIVWLPTLAILASVLPLMPLLAQVRPGPGFSLSAVLVAWMVLADLFFFFAIVWMRVGVTKEILGLRKGSRFVYLPGMDELRVIGSYVLVYLLVYAAMIVAFLAMLLAGAILGVSLSTGIGPGIEKGNLPPALVGVFVLITVVFDIALIYSMIRATWLITPVVVADGRVRVTGSWALLRGNVLRVLVIAFVALLPLLVAEMIFIFTVFMPMAMDMFVQHRAALPTTADAGFSQYAIWCVLAGTMLVIMPLAVGLMSSPAAFAWRALVPPPPPPVPVEQPVAQ
ncbi:MAG TPA: hypothetical protein VGG48_09825 [Rhizomicrobium sp.]